MIAFQGFLRVGEINVRPGVHEVNLVQLDDLTIATQNGYAACYSPL